MSERAILCFGDSNTHGSIPMERLYESRRLGPAERWPGVAAAALGPGWRIIEEGLPGRTTVHADPIEGAHKNGLAVLPAMLESHRPLDGVVLMLGTNDLKARFALPAGDIALSVECLVDAILGGECGPAGAPPRVLVVAPPPILETGCLDFMFAGGAKKSAELAALYCAAAGRRGVDFFDAGTVIRSSPLDGIHFEADQHEALGRAIADKLRAMFP